MLLKICVKQGEVKVPGVLDFKSQPLETKHLNCQPFCPLLTTVKLYVFDVAPAISEKVAPPLLLRYH